MNPRLSLWLLLALPIAAIAACVKQKPATFPHIPHLTGHQASCGTEGNPECLTCLTCHDNVRRDGPSAAANHEMNGASGGINRCTPCHTPKEAARLADLPTPPDHGLGRAIVFSHQKHLPMKEFAGQCIACHGGVVKESGESAFPPMSQCLECHTKEFQNAECTLCHTRQDLPKLLPETFLRHDANWIRRHGIAAARNQSMCQQCHQETQCQDCHDLNQTLMVELRRPDDVVTEFRHRADFMTRHAIDARLEPAQCARCHSTADCESCHRLRGVSALGLGGVSPHPPGWIGSNTASRDFHGRAARRDIVACAACHDQGPATNCIGCHRVGGRGGNPHPNGWKSSRSPEDQMCRYCHER